MKEQHPIQKIELYPVLQVPIPNTNNKLDKYHPIQNKNTFTTSNNTKTKYIKLDKQQSMQNKKYNKNKY